MKTALMTVQEQGGVEIRQRVKVHDSYSLEIKLGLIPSSLQKKSVFSLNAWIFIPRSLDVNQSTYTKSDFYRDLKSNIRLITPVFTPEEIGSSEDSPLERLGRVAAQLALSESRAMLDDLEHHTRMFLSILRSSLRDEVNRIRDCHDEGEICGKLEAYVAAVETITLKYRNLRNALSRPFTRQFMLDYYTYGDEFMSNIIEHRTFRLIRLLGEAGCGLPAHLTEALHRIIRVEREYKLSKGFPLVSADSPDRNRKVLARLGVLKKFMVSELYLDALRRRDGVLIEQVYYSLAAGISMVFATVVAFSFQQKYGNYTMPVFVALVVSYMLKDRIKELIRHFFAHRSGQRYFDQKTRIRLKGVKVGTDQEAVDFVTHDKVPAEVIRLRSRTSVFDEYARQLADSILLYRKVIRLKRESLDHISQYRVPGINEILRLNVLNFSHKMDDAAIPLYVPEREKGFQIISGEKVYYLNLVIRISHQGRDEYIHYRITMNRNGLLAVEGVVDSQASFEVRG
ncbi:MAG TPA: hypothetical protein P5531_09000 [Bacteroidales bacterium]|nr:hypothetical protein [Bacteroidales bacterium]HSA44765.1 hypothetical protein [Bacteroidales bacterium]